MRFEIREFNESSFGESQEVSHGADLAAFEDYCQGYYQQGGDELEDEPARPFVGIIAGRCWVAEDSLGEHMFSAFAYADED